MPTKTTTGIRYEYMHIDMTNIFLNLFAKTISFTPLSSIIIYMLLRILTMFFRGENICIDFDSYHQRKRNPRQMMIMLWGLL
jgi:hypothetical protein